MAEAHQTSDPIISASDNKLAESDNIEEQPPSAKNERSGSLKSSQDAAAIDLSVDSAAQPGSFSSHVDHSVYPPNVYAPQAQTFYYRGYNNPNGEWDEYSQFINAEGLKLGSPGIFNDNPSLVFHTGYGYSPQMPYGPYSPVTPPLPSVGEDAQLYSPQQYPFSGSPYYHQLVSPTMPYSPTPVSQPDVSSLVSLDQQGDQMPFGPRPGYHPSFGRDNFYGSSGTLGFHDVPQSYDGFRSGELWSDWPRPSDRQRSLTPLSPAVSPRPTGRIGSFGQNVGMVSQQQRSIYGLGSGSRSYNKGYLHSGFNPGSSFGSSSISSLGTRSWLALDNSRQRGRGTSSLCSCNGALDILSEQNRGPRALKPKNQIIGDHSSSIDSDKHSTSTITMHGESYKRPEFITEFENAKFFIIKSYSEDNIHKSIKYGIWASTPNGNRKLDAAYQEAKEKKQGVCPVYLLFSVNASAQFCGVAEMVGPVDFDKSVDYWQQDKWSGQFPVKWHIIKDVPNSQFRHIVLENNDNKPVTNSRDTQEVKLNQGIEMLQIFKNYETDMSILDDFDFYEDRQKAMQERKARQQTSVMAVGVVEGNEHHNAVTVSNDFIRQMSKSFAQVVSLEESIKEGPVTQGSASSADAASMGTRLKLEDITTAT